MKKSIYKIPKMDCPSEESLVRLKLEHFTGVKKLEFDLENRLLYVYHLGETELVTKAIKELNFSEKLIKSETTEELIQKEDKYQSKLLWTVLSINFVFFIIEMGTGIIAESMGLIADSLDMLADSFVYLLSLLAVGSTMLMKKKVAKYAGYLQLILATVGIIEITRRFFGLEDVPEFNVMIIVSIIALIANGTCLYLLQKSKSKEAHMRASMIFTSNDVIINIGIIVAAIMVKWLNSNIPDLVVGIVVFIVVIQGAIRILKLSK